MPTKLALIAAGVTLSCLSLPVRTADPGRGQALYELRCAECHSESVHGRPKRVAKNFDEVRKWVARWNAELGGAWNKEDIEDVTFFLNERFYRYSCTNQEC
jgi:cytochrome c5